MTPVAMCILIERYLFPNSNAGSWTNDHTGSDAAWIDMENDGLLDQDGNITDKGKAYLKKALSTPIPVQKWVFEEPAA